MFGLNRGGNAEDSASKEKSFSGDFLDSLPDGIFETNLLLQLQYANKPAFKMFGFTAEELGKNFSVIKLFVPGEIPQLMSIVQKMISGGDFPPNRYRMKRKNGEVFVAEIHSSLIRKSGLVMGFRGIIRDLSEQQLLESELAESERTVQTSEARLQFLLSNAPVAIFAGGADGQISFAEGQYVDLMGLRSSQVIGAALFESDRERIPIFSDIPRALAGEQFSSRAEIAGVLFQVRFAPLRDAEEKISGFIGVAVDITEQHTVEEKLSKEHEFGEKLVSELAHLLSEWKNKKSIPVPELQKLMEKKG